MKYISGDFKKLNKVSRDWVNFKGIDNPYEVFRKLSCTKEYQEHERSVKKKGFIEGSL